MSNLTIDTAAMQACMYNGNNVEKLIIDGTTVWEKISGPFDITFRSYDDLYTYLIPSGSNYGYYEYTVLTDARGKLDIEQIPAISTMWALNGESSPYWILDGNGNPEYSNYEVMLLYCEEFYGPSGSIAHADIADMTFSGNEDFFAKPTWGGFYTSTASDLELCTSLTILSACLLSWWPLESMSDAIWLYIYTDPGSAEDLYSENWLVRINLTDYTQMMLDRLNLPFIDINRDLVSQIIENNIGYCPCYLHFQDINTSGGAEINPELLHVWLEMESSVNPDNPIELGVRLIIPTGTAFFPSVTCVPVSSNIRYAVHDAGYLWLDNMDNADLVDEYICSCSHLDVEPLYFCNALDYRDSAGNAIWSITPIIK